MDESSIDRLEFQLPYATAHKIAVIRARMIANTGDAVGQPIMIPGTGRGRLYEVLFPVKPKDGSDPYFKRVDADGHEILIGVASGWMKHFTTVSARSFFME